MNFWPCSEGYFLSGRPQSVGPAIIEGLLMEHILILTRSKIGGGSFLLCTIGSDGPDALDTKWADFDVEKVNELLE